MGGRGAKAGGRRGGGGGGSAGKVLSQESQDMLKEAEVLLKGSDERALVGLSNRMQFSELAGSPQHLLVKKRASELGRQGSEKSSPRRSIRRGTKANPVRGEVGFEKSRRSRR